MWDFKTAKKHMPMIDKRVYVNQSMTKTQRQDLNKSLKQAKSIINDFFGEMRSSPEIYACSTDSCYMKFDKVSSLAKTIEDKQIVLSPKALNPTTITHELVHAEFHSRLGSAEVWNKIPMWFDEGLAALICDHPEYSDTLEEYSLKYLTSQKQWLNAVKTNKPAYKIARQAVESWYRINGKAGFFDLIERLKKGEYIKFESFVDTSSNSPS